MLAVYSGHAGLMRTVAMLVRRLESLDLDARRPALRLRDVEGHLHS